MSDKLVLVTGATGFIAKHCIAELLREGYRVRATVRTAQRADAVRRAVGKALGGDDAAVANTDFVEADLMDDAGWDDAVRGCTYVLHVASPFPLRDPSNRDELIVPARQGALRVLEAASAAGVERVVMTSSMAAICYASGPATDRAKTEEDWTDPDRPGLTAYLASKTLAERAAWDWVRENGRPDMLAVINPGVVLGPVLDDDLSSSVEMVRMYARGEAGGIPDVSYPISDVRDVALMHVTAMTHPAAGGERWICAEGALSVAEIVSIVTTTLPDLKSKATWLKVPDFAIRLVALADRNARSLLPDLGRRNRLDNSKAREKLGFSFRSAETAARDAVLSMREFGVI
jgi:nucleoside-diphosphate-sugar epimerase